MERRIALERDMQATGTTYTDYATPIQDKYIYLDGYRKPIDGKNEPIVYGPQPEALSPTDGPPVVQKLMHGESPDTKIMESQDFGSL